MVSHLIPNRGNDVFHFILRKEVWYFPRGQEVINEDKEFLFRNVSISYEENSPKVFETSTKVQICQVCLWNKQGNIVKKKKLTTMIHLGLSGPFHFLTLFTPRSLDNCRGTRGKSPKYHMMMNESTVHSRK